jgi:hypothetical protein
VKDYAVYLHSSVKQGGYVVRTRHDGSAAAPYLRAQPVKVFKRESAAQAHADKLNKPRFG